MVYTHQDIQEFNKQIKELLDKWLIKNSKSPHTNLAFMVRNHAEENIEKAIMLINYREHNDNTIFDGYYIPNKSILLNKFSIGSQKRLAKADSGE